MFYVFPRGGLGNVMFNVLFGLSLQYDSGIPCQFIKRYGSRRRNITEYKMFSSLNYTKKSFSELKINNTVYTEPAYHYIPVTPQNNTIYDGYFQSYKYFYHNLKKIKEELWKNIEEYNTEMTEKYNQIVGVENPKKTVMVHIRLGDYLTLPEHHPCVTESGINKAMENITKKFDNLKFLVFSDEIDKVKKCKIFNNEKYDVEFITEEDPEKSFILMTKCDHYIISNSSFSLLAFYFTDKKNATVSGPGIWFGPAGPKYKLIDIYPQGSYIF